MQRSAQSRDGVSRRVICCLARNSNVASEVKMDPVMPPMFVMRVLMSRALMFFQRGDDCVNNLAVDVCEHVPDKCAPPMGSLFEECLTSLP